MVLHSYTSSTANFIPWEKSEMFIKWNSSVFFHRKSLSYGQSALTELSLRMHSPPSSWSGRAQTWESPWSRDWSTLQGRTVSFTKPSAYKSWASPTLQAKPGGPADLGHLLHRGEPRTGKHSDPARNTGHRRVGIQTAMQENLLWQTERTRRFKKSWLSIRQNAKTQESMDFKMKLTKQDIQN